MEYHPSSTHIDTTYQQKHDILRNIRRVGAHTLYPFPKIKPLKITLEITH